MRRFAFVLVFAFAALCSVSCNELDAPFKLKKVDDVCTQMDDIDFMSFCYKSFDVNGDSRVSMSEAAAVHVMNLYSKHIKSLNGIEYFANLTSLQCGANKLTSLDVSKNTALQSLDCNHNKLTSLDVSKNSALQTLNCESNQLTSLDVSKNTALKELYCAFNPLTTIYLSQGQKPHIERPITCTIVYI